MKVTFGKFDGSALDEGTKSIYVDGVEVGYIERLVADARSATERADRVRVTGYQVVAWENQPALTMLEGKEFATIKEACDAVRALHEARERGTKAVRS